MIWQDVYEGGFEDSFVILEQLGRLFLRFDYFIRILISRHQ
jgi:hypothetical protein